MTMDETKLSLLYVYFSCACWTAVAQPNLAALLGGINIDRGFVPSWGIDTGLDNGGGGGGGGGGGIGGGSCPYRPHPDRFKFTQEVNMRTVTQSCAPGTMYDHSVCACVNIPKGASGGGAMPGSNPRLQRPASGAQSGTNPFMAALMSQFQAGSNPGRARPPTRAAPKTASRPSPIKPVSRSKSNPMERLRQLMANTPSPLKAGALSIKLPPATQSSPIQYKPSPPTDLSQGGLGLNSKSGSFPPELLSMIERAQRPPSGSNLSSTKQQIAKPVSMQRAKPSRNMPRTNAASRPTSINSLFQLPTQAKTSSGGTNPDPMSELMLKLSAANPQVAQPRAPSGGQRSDPLAALLAGMGSPSSGRRPGTVPSGTGNAMAALFGGSGSPSSGGGGGLDALLGLGNLGGSSSGTGGSNGGMAAMLSDPRIAQLLGGSSSSSMAAGVLPGQSPPDMTSVFNMQGRMGFGGGIASLGSINIAKMEQLDRQGLIDLSDLTPAGLAAANAHFGG